MLLHLAPAPYHHGVASGSQAGYKCQLPMQAVVLAGGLATRLGERARRTPKYLLPVAGRPFAAWHLERLRECGFAQVVLCIGHLGDQIRAAVGDGRAFGLAVRYSEDGPRPLGTGGALRRAHQLLCSTFLMTYGDSYLPFDYALPLRDLNAHPQALGALAVYRNRNAHDRSNVLVDGELVAHYRRLGLGDPPDPELLEIDYGAMALRRQAVEELLEPDAAASLGQLQALLASRGQLRAVRAERRFYEIGSHQGLAELDELLRHPAGGHPDGTRSQDTSA